MLNVDNYVLTQILVPVAAQFAFLSSLLGIAVGIGVAVRSAPVLRFMAAMNRWVSTRRSFKWVAVPRDTSGTVHRYRLWIGPALIACAVYTIHGLATHLDIARVVAALGLSLPPDFVGWLVESAMWFLILGCLFTIVIGVMLVLFPDALGRLETRVNRWTSSRRIVEGGETMRMSLDNLVEAFPRSAGCTIAAVSLIAAIETGAWLFARP